MTDINKALKFFYYMLSIDRAFVEKTLAELEDKSE